MCGEYTLFIPQSHIVSQYVNKTTPSGYVASKVLKFVSKLENDMEVNRKKLISQAKNQWGLMKVVSKKKKVKEPKRNKNCRRKTKIFLSSESDYSSIC